MNHRLPPQNIDAEIALLGSCLSHGNIVAEITEIVNAEAFYRPSHGAIFQAMADLLLAKQPVDIVTVSNRLKDAGKLDEVGGPAYLCQLTDGIASKASAPTYAGMVRSKADLRAIIVGASELIDRCYTEAFDGNDSTTIEEIEDLVKRVVRARPTKRRDVQHISAIMPEVMRRIEVSASGGAVGVPSGFTDLDKMLCGFQQSDLIILAARPGMGKTSMAINMAQYQAMSMSIPVGVISLEMSGEALGARLVSSVSGVDSHRMRAGRIADQEWPKLVKAVGELSNTPVFLDDTPAMKASIIRRKAQRMKDQHGIEILYLDYLQMAKGDDQKQSREREIAEISGELKAIAKELNIPVVALSQLNRSLESRTDKRPVMADLRDSGAIEQDADVILFIYLDEKYNKSQDNPRKGIAEIIIGKQRNGPTGIIQLTWNEQTTKFSNFITMHERI